MLQPPRDRTAMTSLRKLTAPAGAGGPHASRPARAAAQRGPRGAGGGKRSRYILCSPEGSGGAGSGGASRTSRCLLTQELFELADWLEVAAADPTLCGRFKGFTFGNMINVELIDPESRQLRIYLEWELRPPQKRELQEEFYRDYPVTADSVR